PARFTGMGTSTRSIAPSSGIPRFPFGRFLHRSTCVPGQVGGRRGFPGPGLARTLRRWSGYFPPRIAPTRCREPKPHQPPLDASSNASELDVLNAFLTVALERELELDMVGVHKAHRESVDVRRVRGR